MTSKGIADLKSKIRAMHKHFDITPEHSAEAGFSKVEQMFDVKKIKDPNPISDQEPSDTEFNFDINFTEGELSKLLPSESWFESQLPDFKKLFDF